MPDERSRMTVVQALSEKLGPEVATALMECVPPFPWTEIATKTDLHELEQRSFFHMDAQKFELLAAMQIQANRMIKWTVGAIFGGIAGIGGAAAGIAALVR